MDHCVRLVAISYNLLENLSSRGLVGFRPGKRVLGQHPIDEQYDVLCMKVPRGT